MTRALRWLSGPGSLLRPPDARRGPSCVFLCGLRRQLVSGSAGHGEKFPVTLGRLVLLVSWRPGQSRLHPLSIPGLRPRRSSCYLSRWSPDYSGSKFVHFLPSLLPMLVLNAFEMSRVRATQRARVWGVPGAIYSLLPIPGCLGRRAPAGCPGFCSPTMSCRRSLWAFLWPIPRSWSSGSGLRQQGKGCNIPLFPPEQRARGEFLSK